MLLELPTLSNPALFAIFALFAGLLVVAIMVEVVRKSRARKHHLDSQWHLAKDIADDKQVNEKEWGEIQRLIEHWSAADPLRVVTVRHHFDVCVGKEMDAVRRSDNIRRYNELGRSLRDVREQLALDYIPLGQRIYSTRELFNNQRIWISAVKDSSATWIEAKVSMVDEAYLSLVRVGGEGTSRLPKFKPGEMIRCRLWRDEDARYSFAVPFETVIAEPPTIVLGHTSELGRIQDRQYFRVRHDQSVTVGILNRPVDDQENDIQKRKVVTRLQARITNISAGGFAAVVGQQISRQVLMRLELELVDSEPLEVVARLVSSIPISGGRTLIRCIFVGITDDDRDVIARHVTYKQQQHEDAQARAKTKK